MRHVHALRSPEEARAATDDVAAVDVMPDLVDLDFNIDGFDFDLAADSFDFDDLAADEFCNASSAFVANADGTGVGGGGAATGGWLGELCVDSGLGSREGSPDSGVTDGPLAGDEAMAAYVAELERFMMDDGDAEEVFCADGDGDRVEELVCADYFFGDLLATDFNGIVTAAAGALHNKEEENGDGIVLAAREEDEPTSRKRARHNIKGKTTTPCSGDLEVASRHLARIQVVAPWPLHAAVLLCCMQSNCGAL